MKFSQLIEYNVRNIFLHKSCERWGKKTTISHINYWDQVSSWKKFWKFWNGPLCKNKLGPPPYSVLHNIGRVATPQIVPRNRLRNLQTTLIIGREGLVSEFMCGIVAPDLLIFFKKALYQIKTSGQAPNFKYILVDL